MFSIEQFVHKTFFEVEDSGDELRINCPFCPTEDVHKHLYVNKVKQVAHCFRCGYKRSWVGFIIDCTGYSYYQAIGELYTKPRMVDFELFRQRSADKSPISDKTYSKAKKAKSVLPEGFDNILNSKSPIARSCIKYLKGRGFQNHHIRRYNLGVSPQLPYRIIIPVENSYWQARTILKKVDPKYINPDLSVPEAIFNGEILDFYNEIVVCEGAFSAMSIGDNAVALLGKEPVKEKVDRLVSSHAKKFILTVEPEGRKLFGDLADKLYRNGKEVLLWVYAQGDPNEGYIAETLEYNGFSRIAYKLMYKNT